MHFAALILGMCLSGMVHGVTMSLYKPQAGVEASFETFLKALYASTEDPKATSAFTDFFPPNGELIVRNLHATGANDILAIKQKLLPVDGHKHWNHFPNVTSVDSESANSKVYNVLGLIESTFDGGNCSAAYYSTRFTVLKRANGDVRLAPGSGSLELYDDYVVQPENSPTDIPCRA